MPNYDLNDTDDTFLITFRMVDPHNGQLILKTIDINNPTWEAIWKDRPKCESSPERPKPFNKINNAK